MANLTAALTEELNYLKEDLKYQRKQLEMPIIDPEYFKRRPPSEDEIDAFEKELELKSLPIKRGK
jgi:hypothetical protein